MASAKDPTYGWRLERMVALARLLRDIFALGNRWNFIRATFFLRGCSARVCRPIWRNNAPATANLFLSATSPPQICAVEHSRNRIVDLDNQGRKDSIA